MMALSGGTEAVDFGHRNGCHGCSGSACSGYVGCVGGGHGCIGGGCSGYVSHGCMGGGHGCVGSCHGGGHGGCHGGGGLFSGGLFGGRHGGHGCHGCSGSVCSGYGCSGYSGYGCSGYGCGGTIVVPGTMTPPKVVTPPKEEVSAPATIVVTLPADAKLTVDGAPTTSTSGQRTLITPALSVGMTYVYTLQAEVNGKVQSQQVQVRGGQISQAQFSFPASVASR